MLSANHARKLVTATFMSVLIAGCGSSQQAAPSEPKGDGEVDADWVLQRASMSGACHVKEAASLPNLGVTIATAPSAKEICAEARDRSTNDSQDTEKCFSYTKGAVKTCKEQGITLPD